MSDEATRKRFDENTNRIGVVVRFDRKNAVNEAMATILLGTHRGCPLCMIVYIMNSPQSIRFSFPDSGGCPGGSWNVHKDPQTSLFSI